MKKGFCKREKKRSRMFFGLAFFLLIIDQMTKLLTYLYIPKMSLLYPYYPYGGKGIFYRFFGVSLSINHVENLGAAWGLFSAYPKVLLIFRVLVVLLLLTYLLFFLKDQRKILPFVLIATGAIGNILDVFVYGYVIDMIHFTFGNYSYPIFNLADILISMGILWLFVDTFWKKKEKHT